MLRGSYCGLLCDITEKTLEILRGIILAYVFMYELRIYVSVCFLCVFNKYFQCNISQV